MTIKTKAGEGKETVYDYGLSDARIEDDTEFDPDVPEVTKKLNLTIPVQPFSFLESKTTNRGGGLENLPNCFNGIIRRKAICQGLHITQTTLNAVYPVATDDRYFEPGEHGSKNRRWG